MCMHKIYITEDSITMKLPFIMFSISTTYLFHWGRISTGIPAHQLHVDLFPNEDIMCVFF